MSYSSMFCFVLKGTASTEFYTDLHPLSRSDALPICVFPPQGQRRQGALRTVPAKCRASASGPQRRAGGESTRQGLTVRGPRRLSADSRHRGTGGRSEEHTSELQSLMRISYAVFCLKKKKENKNKE